MTQMTPEQARAFATDMRIFTVMFIVFGVPMFVTCMSLLALGPGP